MIKWKYRYLAYGEKEILQQLNHKNVVKFMGFYEDKKNCILIQQLCSNNSLGHWIRKKGFAEIPECRRFIRQTLTGVEYLHTKNIIHRDLKLSNVFLDENLNVRIGDFGLATTAYVRTGLQEIVGTFTYCAPEVLNRKGASFSSDVWAVAVMTYKLLNGYGPFEYEQFNESFVSEIVRDRIRNNIIR